MDFVGGATTLSTSCTLKSANVNPASVVIYNIGYYSEIIYNYYLSVWIATEDQYWLCNIIYTTSSNMYNIWNNIPYA